MVLKCQEGESWKERPSLPVVIEVSFMFVWLSLERGMSGTIDNSVFFGAVDLDGMR